MSIQSVRRYFEERNIDLDIIENEQSSATVELAAKAIGVIPAMIAKTMALRIKDRDIILVAKGDSRIDNKKYKKEFDIKLKMLDFEEVEKITGHQVGGVCPFGLKSELDIYLDNSLKEFEYVYPAAGSHNSAVKISVTQLQEITNGKWVDVCK